MVTVDTANSYKVKSEIGDPAHDDYLQFIAIANTKVYNGIQCTFTFQNMVAPFFDMHAIKNYFVI